MNGELSTSGKRYANDSIGNKHQLYLYGSAKIAGNVLALDGSKDSYAQFDSMKWPKDALTFTCWVKLRGHDIWARIWDFGNSQEHFLTLIAKDDQGRTSLFGRINKGAQVELRGPGADLLQDNVRSFVAVTIDGTHAAIFINGQPKAGSYYNFKMTSLGTTKNNYLGKSEFPDANLFASYDDFRIYDRELTQVELMQIYDIGK